MTDETQQPVDLAAIELQHKTDIRHLQGRLLIEQAYKDTEKSMRQDAEEQLSKFHKILPRIYWKSK